MKEETKEVVHSAIFSDDERYRFKLTRIWDDKLPSALLVMNNPSKASLFKSDKTITNTMNYLIDKNYGSLVVVNLFPYMETDPKLLTPFKKDYIEENDDCIRCACDKADRIIIGWLRSDDKTRKKDVLKILEDFSDSVYAFYDHNGKGPVHPREINKHWEMRKYKFK